MYIDPPYNTGAKDWRYNNDYVDGNDAYRHSKWLSFMEKRLRIARTLLKSQTGVLIIAIDDYEIANTLGLLENLFIGYEINTVIIKHHPQGGASNNISRTHEYAIFVIPKYKK
ncbi:DNA methyltransferase [Lactococcus lactis]